jgi:hypothetical protein
MYVYTTQKGGKPRMAIAATAALLVLSLALALFAIELKSARLEAILGERETVLDGNLSMQLPVKWSRENWSVLSGLDALVLEEQSGRLDRKLVLFHSKTTRQESLSPEEMADRLRDFAREVNPQYRTPDMRVSKGRIGQWKGVAIEMDLLLPVEGGVYPRLLIGRSVVTPDGHLISAAMVVDWPLARIDERLFDRICESIELEEGNPITSQEMPVLSPPED